MSELKFDIEEQFNIYLEKSGLANRKMHPSEYEGRKNTFYAGAAQLLRYMMVEMTSVPDGPEGENKVIEVLTDAWKQATDYFEGKAAAAKSAKN